MYKTDAEFKITDIALELLILYKNAVTIKSNWFSRSVSMILNLFSFEKLAEKFQLKIMPSGLKEIMNKDSRVIVNDKILKFHLEDKRVGYLDKFNNTLKQLV